MKEYSIQHRALILLSGCGIAAAFFVQAQLALRPNPLSFHPPEIAYGYSDVAFTGTVYTDEGVTNIGSGTLVSLAVNGSLAGSDETDDNGLYSITGLTVVDTDILSMYIDDEAENGALIVRLDDTELGSSPVSGMDIYQNRLILRTDAADLHLTDTELTLADDVNDSDLDEIFTIADLTLTMGPDTELHVWQGTTYTASGAIYAHDVHVLGTLSLSEHTLFASGSLISTGSLVSTGDIVLQSVSTGETLTVTGSSLNNLYFDNGLLGYFRLDEGTGLNASGSTLHSETGGTLVGSASWGPSGTGNTLFFNPFALELDGNGDYVSFNDSYDIAVRDTRTISGWFRRDSATTEDVVLAKRSGTGASSAGYILFIDDEDDKLHFEVSDSTNEYEIVSSSTFTNTEWYHAAVTWNSLSESGAQLYVNGVLETVTRSGTFGDVVSMENEVGFTLGADGSGAAGFDGALDDIRLYSRVLTGSEISFLSAGNKETGSGTYTLGSRLDVNGNFGMYTGRLDVNEEKNYTLFLAGNVSIYGTLLTQSGTVVLDGANQTLKGSTAFKKLTKTVTAARTLTFETHAQQVMSGSLTLNGVVGSLLSLRTTRTGSQTYLTLDEIGTQTLKYLDVKDNNAMSGTTLICTEGCIDSENNNNWQFLGICGDGVRNTGEACDDGNTSNGDTCLNTCVVATCGDTFVNTGAEECEPPGVGTCLNNCFFRGGGGGGGSQASASSAASYYKRPPAPDGCGNAILEIDKGEECDLGTRFNGLGTCSYDCKKLFCGDGEISPQIGEDCEPQTSGLVDGVMTFTVGTCGEICSAPEQTGLKSAAIGGCQRVFLRACDSGGNPDPEPEQTGDICGNGIQEGDEQCDFGGICQGGQFDGSFWTDNASVQTCLSSGGTPKPQSNDGCDELCRNEFCGDGILQERGKDNAQNTEDDEQCDNGSICENDPSRACSINEECGANVNCVWNKSKSAKCSASCKLSVCGNAQVEAGEGCDDGNAEGGDGCSSSCRTEIAKKPVVCGDGLREGLEQCDDGNTADGDGCDASCFKKALCGNGEKEDGEECDTGSANSDTNPNACRMSCVLARCGDGTIDANEECDSGLQNSDTASDACRTSCKNPKCGDGIVDQNEICDGGSGCTNACVPIETYEAYCGNGYKENNEACDDGNSADGDGCNAWCAVEIQSTACGNGKVEEGEQCDDGNIANDDGCSFSCMTEQVKESAPEPVMDDTLEADIVIVNPTEIANALNFVDNTNPCAVMVRKGAERDADEIRRLAGIRGIPIVERISLAHTLFETISVGESVSGILCEQINSLKSASPKVPESPKIEKPIQPMPARPTTTAYGFYNYAALQPIVTAHPAAGETGPGALAVALAGAAGGMAWVRKRIKR